MCARGHDEQPSQAFLLLTCAVAFGWHAGGGVATVCARGPRADGRAVAAHKAYGLQVLRHVVAQHPHTALLTALFVLLCVCRSCVRCAPIASIGGQDARAGLGSCLDGDCCAVRACVRFNVLIADVLERMHAPAQHIWPNPPLPAHSCIPQLPALFGNSHTHL